MPYNRKKTWTVFAVFAVVYLVLHFVIFDRDIASMTFDEFLAEGPHHIIHLLPLIAVFIFVLVRDIMSRRRDRAQQ